MAANNHATFIWSIADLLRGSFKAHQYGDIILPFTVLRRLDAVLAPTKAKVLEIVKKSDAANMPVRQIALKNEADHHYSFYNSSAWDMQKVLGDPDNLAANLRDYVNAFSENVRDIFDKYKMDDRIEELDEHDLLFHVAQAFAKVNLGPTLVPNEEMGHIFEELIRKFSYEAPGEHFTPRDVIELMVDVLLSPDLERLRQPGLLTSVYDPTAGTGGMLSAADDHIRAMRRDAKVTLVGQEFNPQSYAICKADMTLKGQEIGTIAFGDTLIRDAFDGRKFSYCLSNPPFGDDWKKQQSSVTAEHKDRGFAGRFGAGLPAVTDGALLFLQHLVSKMRDPDETGHGGRAAIVLNGSSLYSGGAGSGPSDIRKWILEHDLVEAIIALPDEMFYNTEIATYVWILTNAKCDERRGHVQLIDGSGLGTRLRKSLGDKRVELSPAAISDIVRAHGRFENAGISKVYPIEEFLYRAVTVERPLRLQWRFDRDLVADAQSALASKLMTVPWLELSRIAEESPITAIDNERQFRDSLRQVLDRNGISLRAGDLTKLIGAFSSRSPDAASVVDEKGQLRPDPSLRDTENVPWGSDISSYMEREVLPFVPDAWVDLKKTKAGAAVPFSRYFFAPPLLRPLNAIDAELDQILERMRSRFDGSD